VLQRELHKPHKDPRDKVEDTYACHKASYHHKSGGSSIQTHNLYLDNASMLLLSRKNNFAMGPYVYKEDKVQHDTSNCMDEDKAWESSSGDHKFAHTNGAVDQGYLSVPIPSHTNSYMLRVMPLAANCSRDIAIASAGAAVHLGSDPVEPLTLHFLTIS
jgi:hypothetical protein